MLLVPCRVGKQRLREARTQAVDFLILLLAGLCLGTLAKVSDESFGATGYTYTVIAVCKFHLNLLLRSVSNTFSNTTFLILTSFTIS